MGEEKRNDDKKRSKKSLDYFSFDCDLLMNKQFRRVKQKYGYLGPYIYISILSHIYGSEGYYVRYDDDLIWEIQLDLQGKYQPGTDTISEVVELLVESELFSDYHWQQKYLTSKRIQENYYKACIERTGIEMNWDIWMLSEEEMKNISKRCFILRDFQNRASLDENRASLNENRANLQQTKQNQTKLNKTNSIDDEYRFTSIVGKEPSPTSADNLFNSFENEFGRTLSQIEVQEISDFKEEFTDEVILEALKEAVLNQKLSFNYIRAILATWKKKGIDTAEKARKQVNSFKGQAAPKENRRTLPDWYSNPTQNEAKEEDDVDMDEFQMYLNKIKESKKG